MTDTSQAPHGRPTDDDNQDEISLAPLFNVVWRYRRVIALGLVVTLGGFITLVVLGRMMLPSDQFGAISFRVEMEGAARGEYPNGTKFSPEEIVATPVLMGVYEANDLGQYGGFGDFASAFLVENWSPQRDALTREYQAKLSDTRITSVDRGRLETEFQNKLTSLTTPEFRLSFRRRAGMRQIPSALIDKILQDTLRTWAQHASERKGALSYNIPVLGRSVLRWDEISREDYLIGLDILRTHVVRILSALELFREKLPGADAVRAGEDQMTLEEIKSSLENLQRFTIEPLFGLAAGGVSKQPGALRLYVENQLQQTRLTRDESNRRVTGLEQSLLQYSQQSTGAPVAGTQGAPAPGFPRGQGGSETLIPQFGESFLDRLMQMSSRNEDAEYRQGLTDRLIVERFKAAKLEREVAYYEALSRSLAAARAAGEGAGRAPTIEARMKTAFDQVATAMDHVVALYDQLSKNNLNPSTMLYTVTLPYTQQRVASFTLRQAALWGVALMILASFVLVLAVLIHDRFRPSRWRTAPRETPPSA